MDAEKPDVTDVESCQQYLMQHIREHMVSLCGSPDRWVNTSQLREALKATLLQVFNEHHHMPAYNITVQNSGTDELTVVVTAIRPLHDIDIPLNILQEDKP